MNSIEEKYIPSVYPLLPVSIHVLLSTSCNISGTRTAKLQYQISQSNEDRMYASWNPPTPIENLYEQLVDGQQFATQGGEIIHNSQLAHKCYEIIEKTGVFTQGCKEWTKTSIDEQTWNDIKQFFFCR